MVHFKDIIEEKMLTAGSPAFSKMEWKDEIKACCMFCYVFILQEQRWPYCHCILLIAADKSSLFIHIHSQKLMTVLHTSCDHRNHSLQSRFIVNLAFFSTNNSNTKALLEQKTVACCFEQPRWVYFHQDCAYSSLWDSCFLLLITVKAVHFLHPQWDDRKQPMKRPI